MPLAHYREVVVLKDGQVSLEGLPLRAGEKVEVVVIRHPALSPAAQRYPLHGKPLHYVDPLAPAAEAEEWEANR